MLVKSIDPIGPAIVNELQVLTLGAQLRGSGNVARGQEATGQFFNLLRTLLKPYTPKTEGRVLTFRNASNLLTQVKGGSDPDFSITQKLASETRKLVAIEIKGGTDGSNVWNRLGEAEKSHRSAKHDGFNELWTVLRVDIVSDPKLLKKAKEKSPTTTRFFYLNGVLDDTTRESRGFREILCSIIGLKFSS